VEVKFEDKTFNARAIDISKHGFCIMCPKIIEPGSKIDAVIFLKDPERVSGEVKWATAELDPGQGTMRYKMGVEVKGTILVSDEMA
jgi:hypothetical protein